MLRKVRLCGLAVFLAGVAAAADLDIFTVDGQRQPVVGVEVRITGADGNALAARSGADGHAHIANFAGGKYSLTAAAPGFETIQKSDLEATQVELTLVPVLSHSDSVEVKDSVTPVEQASSAPTSVATGSAKELPSRPATVRDALPLVPGVVRKPDGGLILNAAGEHRSAFIVNSADVTDPATGQFGLTVPIDIVETMNVYQTPFLAEYGRFTADVVSVETRRGGEKFKWELNDPFPDFRIRSYHLRGVRDATPRLNFEGPIIKGKLYFSEGVDYELRKVAVYELPFPYNQRRTESFNSFSQLDWLINGTQLLTATFHVAPQRLSFVNLDYFNPEPTTPDANTRNYVGTISHKWTLFGGVLDNTFSVTRFDARVWGQGESQYTISPIGNSGSYFAQQDRQATRVSWSPTYTAKSLQWHGIHNFKAGASFARSSTEGQVNEHPIDLLNGSGQLFERIDFVGGGPFSKQDVEQALFGQDHWMLSPKLALDLGVRTETQQLSSSFRIAPRAGVAWTPAIRTGTTFRAGFGLFYDRLPLNVYSFDQYPMQSISYFDGAGNVSAGPFLYTNGLGVVTARFPFVIQTPAAGNFSPRSATAAFQVEQPLTSRLRLRVGYTQSQSDGLVVVNHIDGANLLTGTGQSRYHQFEATARVRLNEKRQLYFSYVRAQARGDLNDFSTYLGTFALPILRNNQFGNLPTNLPNRFLTWGLLQLPKGFRIAPQIEFRSGLPYAVTDGSQNWVGSPYSTSFPLFISVDSRVSKDFKVNPKYTVRLSVSGYNLTNHFNPETVHYNTADPAFGYFFGHRGRRFTADFDFIF